jgi:Ca2+-binding EF-hand superfamily protein
MSKWRLVEALLQKREHVLQSAFEAFDTEKTGQISVPTIKKILEKMGLNLEMPSIKKDIQLLNESETINLEKFTKIASKEPVSLLGRALLGRLAIPNVSSTLDQ